MEVNGGPSGGEWQTVRRRKFWGHIFVQRLGVEGHDSWTVRRRLRTVRSSAEAHRRGRRRRLRQRFRVRFVSMSSSGHGELILAIRFNMHGVYEALGHQW